MTVVREQVEKSTYQSNHSGASRGPCAISGNQRNQSIRELVQQVCHDNVQNPGHKMQRAKAWNCAAWQPAENSERWRGGTWLWTKTARASNPFMLSRDAHQCCQTVLVSAATAPCPPHLKRAQQSGLWVDTIGATSQASVGIHIKPGPTC